MALLIEDPFKFDMPAVNDHLSGMFEVHGDMVTGIRLYLTRSPVGACGVAHKHAGFK